MRLHLAIFQMYIVGPLTGSVMASVVCYIMWCGCSARPHLSSFNSLHTGRQTLCGSRTRLLVKPRLVRYLGISHPLDDEETLSGGGPPVCYFCGDSATTPLSAAKNKVLVWRPAACFEQLCRHCVWPIKFGLISEEDEWRFKSATTYAIAKCGISVAVYNKHP